MRSGRAETSTLFSESLLVHERWASHSVTVLRRRRFLDHLRGRSLGCAYASDCSGAEAPWFALRALKSAFSCLGAEVQLVHELSPGPQPRIFLGCRGVASGQVCARSP
eukprot:12512847-Alexandrium_andersonii.AAC.1